MTHLDPNPTRPLDPIDVAQAANGNGQPDHDHEAVPSRPSPKGRPEQQHPQQPDQYPRHIEAPVKAPVDQGWSIGDAGRAFAEVEPVLSDAPDGPDTAVDGGRIGSAYLLAASVRGLSHRQTGIPRQDSYGYAVTADRKWLVLVVADGVSAGKLSHKAAQLVARTAPAKAAEEVTKAGAPDRVDWYEIFEQLAQRILSVGQKALAAGDAGEITPREVADAIATTATIVVYELSPESSERHVYVTWIGDSPAWAVLKNQWRCLTEIKNAGQEVASSAVRALPHLPSKRELLHWQAWTLNRQARVLAMTDGVGDPLGDGAGEVADALAEAWRQPPSLPRFAEQVAFGRKSYDDDRTVVAVWPWSDGP